MKEIINFIWLAVAALGALGIMFYFALNGLWPVAIVEIIAVSLGFEKAKSIWNALINKKVKQQNP